MVPFGSVERMKREYSFGSDRRWGRTKWNGRRGKKWEDSERERELSQDILAEVF